jgi:hypothetical protein
VSGKHVYAAGDLQRRQQQQHGNDAADNTLHGQVCGRSSRQAAGGTALRKPLVT